MANFDPLSMIGTIPSTVLGMALTDWQNQNQYDQQKKLQDLQIKGQMQLGEFNQGLALDTWRKTSYPEQVKLMQQAGLNVGLMYGGAGSGGTTQGGQAGNTVNSPEPIPAHHTVGMAMQMGLATQMQEAQIENIKADTAVKLKDLPVKTSTEKVQLATEENIKQQKLTEEQKTNLAKYQAGIAELEFKIKQGSQFDIMRELGAKADNAEQETRIKRAQANVDEASVNNEIEQIRLDTVETGLKIATLKQGIKASEQTIKLMSAEMMKMAREGAQKWESLNQQQQEIWIKQKLADIQQQATDFETSTPQQIKQWLGIITDVIKLAPNSQPNKIGFK